MARPNLIDQLKASGVEPTVPSGNRLINDLSKNGVQKSDDSLQKLSEGYYEQKSVDDKFVQPLSFSEKASKAWGSGWGSLGESFGAGLEWMGQENDAAAISDIGKNLQKWGVEKQVENYQEISKDIQDFDVSDMAKSDWWAQKATTILPSVLSLMGPSIVAGIGGAAAGAEVGAGLGTLIAPGPGTGIGAGVGGIIGGAMASSAVSRTLEGIMEAGGAWTQAIQELKKQGYSEEDSKKMAGDAASEVFRKNYRLTGVDAVQFALAFAPVKGLGQIGQLVSKIPKGIRVAGVLGGEAGTEAGEELYQNWISSQAINRVKGVAPESFEEFIQKPENKEAIALGAIGGIAFGAMGEVGSFIKEGNNKKDEEVLRKSEQLNDFSDRVGAAKTDEERIAVQNDFRKAVVIDQVVAGKSHYVNKRIDESVEQGIITPEDAGLYKATVKSFDGYMDGVKDTPLTDDQKREVFDLSWQDENVRVKINQVESDKETPLPIKEAKIKALKGQSTEFVNKISGIFKGEPSEAEKLKEKALDDFQAEIPKSEPVSEQPMASEIVPETAVSPKEENQDHKAFNEFSDKELSGKKWNGLIKSAKADIVARHLEEKPNRKITGTLQVGKHQDSVEKYGLFYDVEIGGKRIKMASKNFIDTFGEKMGISGENMVDRPVVVKLIKPEDGNLGELSQNVITKPEGTKAFQFKGWKGDYPYILQVKDEKTGIPLGNLSITDYGGQKVNRAPAEKIKPGKRPSVENPVLNYNTKTGSYKFENDGGDIIITDKEGIQIKGPERKNLIRKYEEQFDFTSGDRVENIPEGMNPEDVHKYIADNSNNPIEIIESYQNARKDYLQNTGTYKNQVISEGITKIKRKGYAQFGDVNNITTEMANSYFSDTGRNIDDLAMEISSDSGMTITEKDIVDFMNDFNSPKAYRNSVKETEPRHMERLRGRFNVLTGLEMNERTIIKALEQQIEKENIDFEPYLEQDFNNYEQARESYEEQLKEYYDQQVDEADGAVTGGEEGTGRGKSGDEEGPAELVQKQKLSDRVQEVAGERQKVIDQLKKALPKVDVVMDSTIDGAGQLDADGNTVRLNPDYNYADTPIHEFGHVLIDITGGAKSRFNKNGIDQLRESKLWAEVAKQYPELDQDMLGKEVLATAIGNEGAIIWKAQKNKSAFRNWLDNFFIRLRDLLGIKESVAKQLARQLLSGKSLSKEMAPSGKVQKQKAKIPAKGWRSWAKSAGFDIVSIEERIAEIEENSSEQVDPELDAERVELEETIKAIKEDYKEYVKDRQQVIDLAESKGDISKMDLDKLLELRSTLSKYDDITNTRFYKDMMFNIGQRINSYRIGEIKEVSPDFNEKDTAGDLKKTDIFMQGLSTISERFPAIQKFYKMYRSAHNYMVGDIAKLKESGDKLAQAVIKEYHKGKGIAERTKDFIVGGGHKYYAYMAKDGKFLTKESQEYNKLSKAQRDLLDFILDNKDRLSPYAFKNTDGYQADALLKSDAGFIETLGKSGVFRAYTNFLGKSYSLREVKVEFKNPETGKVSHEYFGDVENILEKYGKGSAAQKIHAAALVTKYNIAANKRVSMKLNSDGTPLDIKSGNSRFYMTEDGRLIGKSNNEKNKNATENYYEAFMEYAKDATFSEHMSPLMPMFEGVESFYKSQGASKENVVKFLDVVKRGKFLGETIESGLGSTIDSVLRLLRKWTSWRFLAFNIPANLWNIFIGKYSNFRAQGIKESAIGEKRMFESLSKGKDNSKALNILKKFTPDLIVDTNQINPEKYAGRYFEMLAFGGLGFGETYIRGTAIIGRMSKEEYSWIDDKGNILGSKEEVVKREKILRDNIAKYESQVDRIQGRYSDVEKRNFGYFELGRFMGQFKIWIPEWFSERFSDKYLDADNEWHKGSAGALFQFGVKDLLRDITSKEFYISKELKYVNARKNLRGALTMGALMMLYLGASDDDDDKDMANLLNKAMRDMSFIYRMDNAAFLVATPAASMTTVTDFVKALDASFKLQKYKADGKYGDKGDLKAPGMFLKLAPGNRLLDIPQELLDDSN